MTADKLEATVLEDAVKSVFETAKPGMKVKDIRSKVKDAVLSIAHQEKDELGVYIEKHVECYCMEAFMGLKQTDTIQNPEKLQQNAVNALRAIYQRIYGS